MQLYEERNGLYVLLYPLEVGWLSLAKVTRRIFGLCAELSTFLQDHIHR